MHWAVFVCWALKPFGLTLTACRDYGEAIVDGWQTRTPHGRPYWRITRLGA